MPQSLMNIPTDSPTFIPTKLCPLASYKEFENNYSKCHNHRRRYRRNYVRRHLTKSSKNNYWKCHNHRRIYRRIHRHPYRWNYVRWHLTESLKIITWNATIIDDHTDVIMSIGNLSVGKFYWQKYRRNVRIPKGVHWMHL